MFTSSWVVYNGLVREGSLLLSKYSTAARVAEGNADKPDGFQRNVLQMDTIKAGPWEWETFCLVNLSDPE